MITTPPAGPKLTTLEYGRFIAASLVVFSHIGSELPLLSPGAAPFGGLHTPGPAGVEYFFTLSGFVILTAHYGDLGYLSALPRYLWRRLCRIYPAFWLALALPFALPHPPLDPGHALGLITLASPDIPSFIGPAWSLRYELAFYLSFALLLVPRIGPLWLALWLAGVAWLAVPAPWRHMLNPPPLQPLHLWLNTQGALWFGASNFLFAAGLFAAWHYRRRQLGARACLLLLAAAVICLVVAGPAGAWYQTYPKPFVYPAIALGFGGLILALANLERLGIIPRLPAAALLGNISYPLYLLHTPLMLLAFNLCPGCLHLQGAALYALFAAVALTIYAAATAVTVWFDQPLQRALRRVV
jgi:peptidoglycan/LPS O-acetylase OafA/YrhL